MQATSTRLHEGGNMDESFEGGALAKPVSGLAGLAGLAVPCPDTIATSKKSADIVSYISVRTKPAGCGTKSGQAQ